MFYFSEVLQTKHR